MAIWRRDMSAREIVQRANWSTLDTTAGGKLDPQGQLILISFGALSNNEAAFCYPTNTSLQEQR
jgi:hypothetical protein